MGQVIDLLYDASTGVWKDRKLLLDIDFMMNIFSALYEMLPEYKDYLDYFFENKETTVIGSSKSTDHGLGIDEAMVELFMPNQKQNRQLMLL